MKYFKNTELAKLYNVSEKSVRNWISAAKQGKLDLELYEDEERQYIISSSHNKQLIQTLVERGQKYKNSRGHKVITPGENFYRLYSPKAVYDIVSSLDIYREIPVQYSYFDGGAQIWDAYVTKMAADPAPNILSNNIELLDLNMPTSIVFSVIQRRSMWSTLAPVTVTPFVRFLKNCGTLGV